MKESFMKKHPVALSFAYVVLLSLFAAIGSIIAGVFKLSQIHTMLVQAGVFLLSAMLAFVIIMRSKYSFQECGLQLPYNIRKHRVLGFVPLILVEGIVLIVGFDKGITPAYIMVILLWTTAAVINEEMYFRGLILKTLSVKGTRFAIVVSSLFFGFAHLGNLALGKGIAHSLLFVAFSALIGFIYAEIAVITRSLLVPVIWHFIHNLISSITAEASYSTTLTIVSIQCVILLSYAIYLWISIKGWERVPGDKAYISFENN